MTKCNQRHFVRLRIYSDEAVGDNSSNKYLVLEESRLWFNQTDITYSFLEDSLDLYKKKAFVTTAMDEYTKYANVRFVLAEGKDANVRISFKPDAEHGSMVGTDALMVDSVPTVNMGGMDLESDDKSNFAIALHAIGHVLGLLHEVEGKGTNFKQYEGFSVMAYSGKVGNHIKLSERDKAWLALNYPKAPFNKAAGSMDIWTPHRFLRVLNIDSTYSAKILMADDILERRLLYCRFLASEKNLSGKVSVLSNLKGLGVYPVAVPGQQGVLLQKIQAHARPAVVPGYMTNDDTVHPVEIEQCAFSLLHAFGIPPNPFTPSQTLETTLNQHIDMFARIQSILEVAASPEPGNDEEIPPEEESLTRAELDGVMALLPKILKQDLVHPWNDHDFVSPTEVQYGPLHWIRSRAARKVLRWVSNMISWKSYDVRRLPPQINQKLLGVLTKSTAQDVFQEIYHLCFASTLVHDLNGTQAELQAKHQELLGDLLPEISDMGSNWELKWGPVVWKEKPNDTNGGPDLVWYVAYNPPLSNTGDHSTYVVAIAGTQMRSIYTWLHSNLHVTSVTDFASWVENEFKPRMTVNVSPNKPYIALGTACTVGRLLTVQAPPGAMSAGQTLLQFLKSASQSQASRFIITGHSLGAALTPPLALALGEAGIVPHDRILTYPIAGPSPGNSAFSSLFSKKFPPKREPTIDSERGSYKVWNLNLVNEYDLVPQAWSFSNLETLLKMFPFHLKLSIRTIVYWIFDDLVQAGVQYTPTQNQRFFSTIAGVLEQHSNAYHELVGITPPALRHVLT